MGCCTSSRRCSGSPNSSTDSRRARAVEIERDLVGDGIALAREHEPARDLVILEREIDVHVDLAVDEQAAARRADAALARIRQLDAVPQPRIDDVLAALFGGERPDR